LLMAWDLAQYQANVAAGLIPADAHLFADDAAFQTLDKQGDVMPNQIGVVYSIPEVPPDGIPIPSDDPRLLPVTVYNDIDKLAPGQSTVINTDANGYLIPFCTPPGMYRVWVDFGAGRVMLTASDFGENIADIDPLQKPNPWQYTQTQDNYGMVITGIADSLSQIFQIRDHLGAPIFSVGNVGGPAAYGDNMTVFDGSFNVMCRLGLDGTLILDGSTLTNADIDSLHTLIAGGGGGGGSIGPDPWTFTMSGAGEGLIVKGDTGNLNAILSIKNVNGDPLFQVQPLNGTSVIGGQFKVSPSTFATPTVVIDPAGTVKLGATTLVEGDVSAVHALGTRGGTNGYATLDAAGTVPRAQLQASDWNGDLLREALQGTRNETRSRMESGTNGTISSGFLYIVPIYLIAGTVVNSISFVSGSTPAASPTHQWFGLYDQNRVQLATTVNDTTTAWGAGSIKTLNISRTASGSASSFTATYSGLYYLGICVAASTTPTLLGGATAGSPLHTLAPQFGVSNGGQTSPPTFPFTATTPTGPGPTAYAYTL
jgi:hypothetical protein